MGFEAKALFLHEVEITADSPGPTGEDKSKVWKDLGTGIDFQHITRLEKVVGERFRHLSHAPFRRAGICAMECFLGNIFDKKTDEDLAALFAPEILVPKPIFPGDDSVPTVKVGGRAYVDCHISRLKGRAGNEDLVEVHNRVVAGRPDSIISHLKSGRWMMGDPPLFWASCADMGIWLTHEEERRTETWQAIEADRISLAIVRGWRLQLREMGEVGARAIFRIS